MTIANCTIKSTFLGKEDHGIPTCFLHLEGNGYGQGFGGYDLRHVDYFPRFVIDLPKVLGARSWEALPGMICRVEHNDGPGMIIRVGHIIKDDWFEAPT